MIKQFYKSEALSRFFRDQGIFLFIALIVSAIFWAIGEPANPYTVIVYSLRIGNFLSPPMRALQRLYQKPWPYDWLIFLILLGVLIVPVYVLTTVIV